MLKSVIFIIILANYLIAVKLECNVNVLEGAPIFTKQFRKRTITLPKTENSQFSLKFGEKINAHCSKGLILKSQYRDFVEDNDGVLNVELECGNNGIMMYNILDSLKSNYLKSTESSSFYINCLRGTQIYESDTVLKGCENYTSIGIGTALQGNKQIVDAAICFDFDTLTTKYVKYLASRRKLEIFNTDFKAKLNVSKTSIIDLDIPMESFETMFNDLNENNFGIKFKEMQKNNQFLSIQEFEYVDLVQDQQLNEDIKNFKYFLNTVWWRNLRLGNWKFFLNALKARTENVKYIIYTGTSGQLTMPSVLSCKDNEVFQLNNFESSFQVPEIIWAYVKPVIDNERDEFVVFGYNTPFYSKENETIKCKDICTEIDWLQNDNFGKTNLFPAFGVVHCCRPAEVATQLDTFPMEKLSKNLETTEKPKV